MVMRMVSPNPMFGSLSGPSPLAQGIMGPMSPAGVGGRPPMGPPMGGMPPMGAPMMGAPMPQPPMGMPQPLLSVGSAPMGGVGGTGASRARFGAMLGGLGGVRGFANGGSVDDEDGWGWDASWSDDAWDSSWDSGNDDNASYGGLDDSYEGFSDLGGSYGGGDTDVGFDYDRSTGTFVNDDGGGYISYEDGVGYRGDTPSEAIFFGSPAESYEGFQGPSLPDEKPIYEYTVEDALNQLGVSPAEPIAQPITQPTTIVQEGPTYSLSGGSQTVSSQSPVSELDRPVSVSPVQGRPVDAGIGAVSKPSGSQFAGQVLGSAAASALGLPASFGADLGGRLLGGVDLFGPTSVGGPGVAPPPRPDVVRVSPGEYSFGTVAGEPGQMAYMATRDLPRFGIEAGQSAVPAYGTFDPRSFFSTDPGVTMRNLYGRKLGPTGEPVPEEIFTEGDAYEMVQKPAETAAPAVPQCPEGFVFDAATQSCVPALNIGSGGGSRRSLDEIMAGMGGSRVIGAPQTAVPVGRRINVSGMAAGGPVGLTDSEVSMGSEIGRSLASMGSPVRRRAGSLEGAADRFLSRLGSR